MSKHSAPTHWAATILDTIIDCLVPFLDGWKQYPPQWDGNGDDYIGRHRR